MSGIGVVVNPLSKRNRRDTSASLRLARIVGDTGVVAECRNFDDLYRAAEDFRRQKVSILAIGGGDGTNSVTTTGFYKVYGDSPLPMLALLRGGTMNTVANSVGIPREPQETLLRWIVDRYRENRPMTFAERTTMSVNDKLGFMCGAGVVYGFLSEYYEAGKPFPTPVTAVKTLARGICSAIVNGEMVRRMAAPVDARIVVDGYEWPMQRYFTITAGTIDEIGLGFKPWYRASERDDMFHFLALTGSPLKFASRLPRVYRGVSVGEDCAAEALAREVEVHTPDNVVRYMVDGDLHEAPGPMRIKAGPRVRIIVR